MSKNKKGKEEFPHFRYYIKSKHPALITNESIDKKQYEFHGITSYPYDGKHRNIKVIPNPDTTKKSAMYIKRRKKYDDKKMFKNKYEWKVPKFLKDLFS